MSKTPTRLPASGLDWPIEWAGVELIALRESCRLAAYKCPAGRWTCGWGETSGVTARTRWTQEYCDQRFCESLTEYAARVQALCTRPPTDNELAAMASLAYNIGFGDPPRKIQGFATSSVLRAHNRGDAQSAARAFGLWNKATIDGALKVLPGLTARRAAEAALYLAPDADGPPAPMPQAVQAESSLAASPINTSGAVTVGSGVVAALAQGREHLGPVGDLVAQAKALIVDTIGLPPSMLLPALLIGAGGAVLYWRWQQRRQGWA